MRQGIITKTCAVAAALAMGVSLAACGGGSSADSDKGHVYFMNNKAEVVDQYKQLAEMYTEKPVCRWTCRPVRPTHTMRP